LIFQEVQKGPEAPVVYLEGGAETYVHEPMDESESSGLSDFEDEADRFILTSFI
jgi:hypothetical protein